MPERPENTEKYGEYKQEAPAGFEPAMADLQSAALATWPRRLLPYFKAY